MSRSLATDPLLSMAPGGMRLVWLFMGLIEGFVILLGVGLVLFSEDGLVSGGTMALTAIVVLVLVWTIVPRCYEVYADRLRLQFPSWRWDIPFDTIASVAVSRWWQSYAFHGLRFATAPNQSIVLLRKDARVLGRPNLVISPLDRGVFLPALEGALERYQQTWRGLA